MRPADEEGRRCMKAISLKLQVTFLMILIVGGLVAAFSWVVTSNEKQMILNEVAMRVVLQGRNIALSSAKPLLQEDPEFELNPLVSRVMEGANGIVSIIVVGRDGEIKGHSDLLAIDRVYAPTQYLRKVGGVEFLTNGEELLENDDILEVSVPVTDRGEKLGKVYLQYSKDDLDVRVAEIYGRMSRVGLLALAVSALVSLLLALHVTRPVSTLTAGAEAIGMGKLDTRIEVRAAREIQTLARTFNEMAKRLADSKEAMLGKERMEKELEIAHDIQFALLPSSLPHLLNYEIDAYYHPATEVGGDYFDLIPLGDGYLMFVVGDVSGKGVPGLVVMAMVRILVRALAERGESPCALLRHLNVLLRKNIRKNMFVTLFVGLLDSGEGTLDFASAAHMPLLLYHSGEGMVRLVNTRTKPLGLFSDDIFVRDLEEKKVRLMPGDLLMQFTDGLSEMRSAEGCEFGIDRVMQGAADEAAGGARHFLAHVKESLRRFQGDAPQSDDLTLLAISALPCGMNRAPAKRMERLDKVAFE